ncbi:stem cell self-renewal protein Piwi domain-containing protein [uncultured Acinetobacter sp.]|uniref:argonaute/piwi family protein n=1 Tax=uncultured Acinetobacter sp. TaxID=165433 RepID=UPI002585BA70|nr:stem cell self-renewal protein Piwi domain-containing protein [uncultured Acinetobacter sp.]
MTIELNAFPIDTSNLGEVEACEITYNEDLLYSLRNNSEKKYHVIRDKNKILIFSSSGQYPQQGNIIKINLRENYKILCFLIRESIIKTLTTLNRTPIKYKPVEFISQKDNLTKKILGENYPFQINAKYSIDTRIIRKTPCIIIDCSTKKYSKENLLYFIKDGFDLTNRYTTTVINGKSRRIGKILNIEENSVKVQSYDKIIYVNAEDLSLEANSKNIKDYLNYKFPYNSEQVQDKIKISISYFTQGTSKLSNIQKVWEFLCKYGVYLFNGKEIKINTPPDITQMCKNLDYPRFFFSNNRELSSKENGLKEYGPYTKNYFDRNNPSICVICNSNEQGKVEQFLHKFLKGIPNSQNFKTGFEGKFHIGISQVEFFTTSDDRLSSYQSAIQSAIQKRTNENYSQWDLAIVQTKKSFKKLSVESNPYFIGKKMFFQHQIPVQDFTIELTNQNDRNLEYSLNNMALASYAKMGGKPWLLKSAPTISHELVIGIGSTNITDEDISLNQRIMGITTVFSGDGSYIIGNTSKAVLPNDYFKTLIDTLEETINKVEKLMNWQTNDTIRLIFHASVKTFNKNEILAVKEVINKYNQYNIKFSFLKISSDHGLHLFDHSTKNESKGKLAPKRGKYFELSSHEILLYLVGQRELKQISDGHPQGIIVSLHRDSTFQDLKYLSNQIFNFSSHSWRSYFPSPLPVTIHYSDLIADNLGWLNKLSGWDDTILLGKLGQTQWFL